IPNDVELYGRPSMSANGRVVVFVGVREGVRQVYIRRLDKAETRAVPGTEGAAYVDVSADGRVGALVGTDTRLKRLSFETDLVEPVLVGADILAGLSVAPDGTVVFVQGRQLVSVAPGLAATRALVTLDPAANEAALGWPVITASGSNVLFTVRYGKPGEFKQRIEIVPLSGGNRRVVVEPADQPIAALAHRIVFVQNSALIVSEFDEAGAHLIGQASRFPEDVLLTGTGALAAAISHDGSILFAGSRISSARLVWVDAAGVEQVIPGPARLYQNPRVSPDGQHIVFAANGTIWILDPV